MKLTKGRIRRFDRRYSYNVTLTVRLPECPAGMNSLKETRGGGILAGGESVEAFVLITVPANNSGGIVRRLLNDHKESVTEAAAVYGEADVIARVKAPSILELHELIMGTIQNLPNVLVTRTFIIIPPPYAEG